MPTVSRSGDGREMKTVNTKSKRIQVLIGSALPMLLIGSLQADTSLAAERPDFSGDWQLNEELSENPRDKMMEKMGGGRGRGGSGGKGGGGMGGGMRGGGGSGGSGGGSREDMQARFEDRSERIKAKWKGSSRVVFKSESANGAEITEIYELNQTGDLLFVTTKMEGEGRRPDISFRRVYDRVAADVLIEPDPEEAAG